MNFITDYQLDIDKGFMCKVNGITFTCEFKFGQNLKWFVSQILLVADAMEIPRQEFIGIFNNKHINHVIYCDSRQECYDLCQIIVKTYFKPKQTGIETYIIKKEKTYENQLRKERVTISRGAKPAGSIIHGRRGKASIRRGCIKHQTCIGY